MRVFGLHLFLIVACMSVADRASAAEIEQPTSAGPDPVKGIYADYVPDFVGLIDRQGGYNQPMNGWKRSEEEMRLSSEPKFFTLNVLAEDSRANALVEAGLKKEADGQHREALKIYQQVIEQYPHIMYRVSEFGVFIPVAQYCQRRILQFPPDDLRFYRTLYDAAAREAFEQAERSYSLLGLSDIAERMMATSFGGRAVLALGDAALDAGHYLAALEHYTTIRDFFPDRDLHTPELALKIDFCQKQIGSQPQSATLDAQSAGSSKLSPDQLARLRSAVDSATYKQPAFPMQHASAPHVSADDYSMLPPSVDPLGLDEPVWQQTLPGTRDDFFVYTQPTVTENSVICRHQNLVFCRSILNGELRWTYDEGGRSRWQNWGERQYPQEDVLVQDGLVFTTVNKSGPSLVALDETTGQLRWAYGPMVAANEDQARMRFEAAPAGGPSTVFAGYILDNIEGETHTDTEYGIMAWDSTTGRIHWQVPVCRLAPGKFSSGVAETRRNRNRSFSSPPLYHEGTVYYNTNAGAIVAIEALSGRIKWLMRYPYYPGVHDATREFGRGGELVQHSRVYFTPHTPMFWYNQRPLVLGQRLYFTPVDTNLLMCLDRRTGRVVWSKVKDNRHSAYLLGATGKNELVIAYTGRKKQIGATETTSPIHLVDAATGETTWESPDVVVHEDQPSLKNYTFGSEPLNFRANESWFEMNARPLLTSDGRVYIPSFRYVGYPIFGYFSNLGILDLESKEIVGQRRYLSGEILARLDSNIHQTGPEELKAFQEKVNKDEQDKQRIKLLEEVVSDTVPVNEHGPFLPFSRITFERYGVPFELRITPRSIGMVYDRDRVGEVLQAADETSPGEADPARIFALAELAIANSRLEEAAERLETCLTSISSEDLNFRAAINQQLYGVHQGLARRAIRAGRNDDELAQCLGMSRTAGTLAQEIETLFAVADAFERRRDYEAAAKALRAIIATYGHHEYPLAPISVSDSPRVVAAARDVMHSYGEFVENSFFGAELSRSLKLLEQGFPLYFSTVSPLPKTLTVRAGELAAMKLMRLQAGSAEFAMGAQSAAAGALKDRPLEELLAELPQHPLTKGAQVAVDALWKQTTQRDPGPQVRQLAWQLADIARVTGLELPLENAPAPLPDEPPIQTPQTTREHDFADEEEIARLVLPRRGQRSVSPELLFVAARVRKRLDNKFTVTAMNLTDGSIAWQTEELRLRGKGQEPGFYTATVFGDVVVVHGLYDVLALQLSDGAVRWHHHVPFDFEIRDSVLSGDMLLLSGNTETLALYVPTDNPLGEVAWQVSELGDPYIPIYVHNERVVSIRKMPFNVTVRYRLTGRMIGRLDLPDLALHAQHPLLENGSSALPAAHVDNLLVVTDSWYYVMLDINQIGALPATDAKAEGSHSPILWKRLIDNNDVTRQPAMRFALSPKYFAVLKEDYDMDALYMLSTESGGVLWKYDPKDSRTPRPMDSLLIAGETIYGIEPHAGQGFYVTAYDCASGKNIFRQETADYQAKPEVNLLGNIVGGQLVVTVADRQDFELRTFDAQSGEAQNMVQTKGVGPFNVHGRMSATVQHGRLILLSKDKLSL